MKASLPTIALTGATGFVGGTLLKQATMRGHLVRALTRQPQPIAERVRWIDGALDRPDALARLTEGADVVIHVAGMVNAPDHDGFVAGNVTGTLAMVEAAKAAGMRRFIHVSSLSAREPGLSDYGWSKARAEQIVAASGLDWTSVRPPAIYGPGDRDMLELFRMARRGLVLLPPPGRLSVIEVSDLGRLLLALIDHDDSLACTYEADDGVEGGWSHAEFAAAIGVAVGRKRVRTLAASPAMLRIGARIDRLLRRGRARLTLDRAAYFSHSDWTIDPAARPPVDLWSPHVPTAAGLAATAAWYRGNGLLR